MLTHFKPNARGTCISEMLPHGRRKALGTIHNTKRGPVFVAAKPLTRTAMSTIQALMPQE
jgi:hypothetical protein